MERAPKMTGNHTAQPGDIFVRGSGMRTYSYILLIKRLNYNEWMILENFGSSDPPTMHREKDSYVRYLELESHSVMSQRASGVWCEYIQVGK